MSTPFYSVVIPLYNKSKYIARTIKSVLNQSFSNFEVIVVDDGSTDDSAAIVEAFKDSRIRVICKENGGVSSARNRGIQEAIGRYIAFLDADDEWCQNKLKANSNFLLKKPECKWVVSGFIRRYKNRNLNIIFCETGMIIDALTALSENMIVWTGAVVISKDCFTADCFFPSGIHRSEDREVWLKLACRFPKIGYLGEVLAIYNAGVPGSLTGIAICENDMSCFRMEDRLRKFTAPLGTNRREAFNKYVYKFNRRACFSFWIINANFLKNIRTDIVEKYLEKSEIRYLIISNCLPVYFKKIISKCLLFQLTFLSYK